MTCGVCLFLVGFFVFVSLAGCGRGFFQEREPWRAEAEIACLKSGAVKESAEIMRIDPITGPGMSGADFPLKVAALGESVGSFGFADEDLRPPAAIGNQPRWPINQPPRPSYPPASNYPQPYPPRPATPQTTYQPTNYPDARQVAYAAPPSEPLQLNPPSAATGEDDINLPAQGGPRSGYRQQPTRSPINSLIHHHR